MAETKKQEKNTTSGSKKVKPRKKRKLVDVHGVAHIHATVNNTIVTITDLKGNAIT
jgi:small subunit ribosomal protein S11